MLSDDEFRKLLLYFDRPWAGYRKVRKGVKKRVRRHMELMGCTTLDGYLQILEQQPEEKANCADCLIVTISRFFRDRKLWQHLQTHVLPELARRFPAAVNIWSAGCANGEEPYSLAIAWESLPTTTALKIVATDANSACLERARLGRYDRSSFKELPAETVAKCFRMHSKNRHYTISQHLKKSIQWQQHNFLDQPLTGPFQMIFLRNNLLTYYQGTPLKTAFENIVQTLVPKGYLVVGSHEQLPVCDIPLTRDSQCPWVYQRN